MRNGVFVLSAIGFLGVAFASLATAQVYSDQDLLQKGEGAYREGRCVSAARFLFAYQLRNPIAIQNNAAHREAVGRAIKWCEENSALAAGGKGDDPSEAQKKAIPPENLASPQGGAIIVGPPPATGPRTNLKPRCLSYARIAVAQQSVNRELSCRQTGARWSLDFDSHYQWCEAVPASKARPETQARQQALDRCAH